MSMRRIAEGQAPPLPGAIRVEFVSPGGLAVRMFRDGAALMRVCAGHLEAEDGLLAEMERGREPAPWESAAARREALDWIGASRWIDDDTRDRLLRHVGATPWYESGA